MRHRWVGILGLCVVLAWIGTTRAQPSKGLRDMAPDMPGEDDVLNEEIWHFVRKTPYSEVVKYLETRPKAGGASFFTSLELPTGWRISPAGVQIEVGRFPHEAVFHAGHIFVLNTGYYAREPQEISIIHPDSGKVTRVVRMDSMFPCALPGLDGDLYVSGGISGKVVRLDDRFNPVREYTVHGYAAGMAVLDATRLVVLTLVTGDSKQDYEQGKYRQGRISILNTVTGEVEREAPAGYFPHSVRTLNGKLYVTLLGEDKVRVFDARLNPLRTIDIDRAPQDICTDGKSLFVLGTNSDTVSVVDSENDAVVSRFEVKVSGNAFGSGPTSCAVDGDRLFVTQSNVNAVAVLDKRTGKAVGSIPTGWYPTKVGFFQDKMMVLSARGIRPRRPNVDGPQPYPQKGGPRYVLTLLKGSLAILPREAIPGRLPSWTRQVERGSPLLSPAKGFRLPIRHIFYIVRENRTYDQVLGDLGRGDGDPLLTLFGEQITPNAHRLAREFVTLDNYFANGEVSVLGHSFTTSGYASPFLEWLANAYSSNRFAAYPFGSVPAVTSPSYLWDALEEKGIEYRIYGENYYLYTRAFRILTETYGPDSLMVKKFYAAMMSVASRRDRGLDFHEFAGPYHARALTTADAMKLLEDREFSNALSRFLLGDESLPAAMNESPGLRRRFAEYLCHYAFNYRSWDLRHSDLERARVWRDDFQKQLGVGRVAQLHYIWLPNDHTGGTDPAYLPPDQLVAQNDAALGFIVEAISRSPVWKESLILVTEDDAQNGPDHVDATRTVALAAGPHVKRNAVIHDRYDQLSMLRTIEALLGLPPLNMNDALAVPMFGIFSKTPDLRPYSAAAPPEKLSDADRQLFHRSHSLSPSP